MRQIEAVYDVSKFLFAIGITFSLFGLSESGIITQNTAITYFAIGMPITIFSVLLFIYCAKEGFPLEDR